MIRVRLRTCPVCRSKAVSAIERAESEDDSDVHVEVRCGECWTWRAGAIGWRAADALERRLRRDRDRMAITLGQGERWLELELGRLVKSPPTPPQGTSRKTHR